MVFSRRTVIVTGGTGALGSVVVRRFGALGANIGMPLHSKHDIDDLISQTGIDGPRLVAEQTDLTRESDVERFVQHVFQRFGRIDIVVNCAGGYLGGKNLEEHTSDEVRRMFDLNALTVFVMCRTALPYMKKAGFGRIVNVASMTALHPSAGSGAYVISKTAVVAVTETIAAENKGKGITANAVAPGTIVTDANKASMPNADVTKWVTPDQVADVILFLSSEESARLNGTVMRLP